jgi:hypothetical protein
MEASDAKKMNNNSVALGQSLEEQLSELFGSYKAEWLKERLFDLFTAPDYLPELTTARPCVLVGGRGTGKTTVLRGLSYEGQAALSTAPVSDWEYYGFYYRVNTNRVTAFKGPELPESEWARLFAHYFNMLLCDAVFRFLFWYQLRASSNLQLDRRACTEIASSFHLEKAESVRQLADGLHSAMIKFEAYVNNVADSQRPPISMQGVPVDVLLEAAAALPEFKGKHFFFLLDEYENFEDYQQQVVNTLIKHSGHLYSFKVGVRELGWRRRTTLNVNEQLISPADYVRINIGEKLGGDNFGKFAMAVCHTRLSRLRVPGGDVIRDIQNALPGLSEDEEAELLGVAEEIKPVKEKLQTLDFEKLLENLNPLRIYLIKVWSEAEKTSYAETFKDFVDNRGAWETRYANYKHSLLYSIRRRKRGIRKYYAGWEVFTQLAANNIRYFLELVDQSLLLQLRHNGKLSDPVPPEIQTMAAQSVGRKNLSELEGLSVHGAQLTKLLLGLGRVFQVMAAQPFGHAPEVNQFHLSDGIGFGPSGANDADNLLRAAVMHLALLRYSGNKLADETDTRDYDYMVHPVFSAFFVFSYRHKRKMLLSAEDLIGLVKNPKETIERILLRNNRTPGEELPEQVLLFEGYYGGHA